MGFFNSETLDDSQQFSYKSLALSLFQGIPFEYVSAEKHGKCAFYIVVPYQFRYQQQKKYIYLL